MTDRITKFLIGIVAVALSVIALHPFVSPMSAEAQAPTQAPKKVSYQLVETGGPASIDDAQKSINEMAAKGWRAKSIATSGETTVVLMEKSE